MTVRLTVRRAEWNDHVRRTAADVDGLVPVVKGNGYGFGRATLHPVVAGIADEVCVGTVHELDHLAGGVTPIVLTPTRRAPADTDAVLTVASPDDLAVLVGWHGRVLIKLRSSMFRFGIAPRQLDALTAAIEDGGQHVAGASIHLPLAGTDADRRGEIDAWLEHLDPAWPVYVSHLAAPSFAALQHAHPRRAFRLRAGTALWHGDKSFLHLGADVLATQPVNDADGVAGYHARPVASGATVVMIGAGTANGVAELAGGASPFHYRRRRLTLVESPHMHTSMAVVAPGDDVPEVGEMVDVQRPLITTSIDELVWDE